MNGHKKLRFDRDGPTRAHDELPLRPKNNIPLRMTTRTRTPGINNDHGLASHGLKEIPADLPGPSKPHEVLPLKAKNKIPLRKTVRYPRQQTPVVENVMNSKPRNRAAVEFRWRNTHTPKETEELDILTSEVEILTFDYLENLPDTVDKPLVSPIAGPSKGHQSMARRPCNISDQSDSGNDTLHHVIHGHFIYVHHSDSDEDSSKKKMQSMFSY